MLPSVRRIKRTYFKEIFRSGRFFQGAFLTLAVLRNPEPASPSRFSFSVSKKVASGAVFRNKLRRRGYGAVQELQNRIKAGYWAVFVFKELSAELSFRRLQEEVGSLLRRAGLLI